MFSFLSGKIPREIAGHDQMIKNLPAMQDIWVQSPSREDPLEKGMATRSSILAWRIPWTSHGVTKELDMTEAT